MYDILLKFMYIFTYFQVAPLRGDKTNFFVSYVAPFKSVTARTLARWMKDILSSSDVDTSLWDYTVLLWPFLSQSLVVFALVSNLGSVLVL